MMTLEILRALAGIAASDKMSDKVKEEAEELMRKAMKVLEKQMDMESQIMKKSSAEMNGIIS